MDTKYNECFEIIPTAEQIENASLQKKIKLKSISFGKVDQVFHVAVDEILDTLTRESDEINRAENNHSDLVAGVYEGEKFINYARISILINFSSVTGGAKIWECTQDLGELLCEQKIIENFANKKVLGDLNNNW